MVPENTGCYGVRGLESWAATTSYLAYGAELDREPWRTLQGGVVQSLPHGYRVIGTDIELSRILQTIPPDAGTWTFACVADTGASTGARLRAYQVGGTGSVFCNLDIVPGFKTHSCTTTITGTPTHLSVNIYPGSGHVDVAGCWLTRTDTPGRPCWGGEAPVTCAADRHTISTEGWPTTEGEITISFTVGESTAHRYIIAGRASGDTARSILMVSNQGLLRLYRPDGSFATGPSVTLGVQHVVRLRPEGERTKVFLDGVEVMDVSGTLSWAPTATIGRHFTLPNESLNCSISSIRVRSFE